jgi:hypothetical protein
VLAVAFFSRFFPRHRDKHSAAGQLHPAKVQKMRTVNARIILFLLILSSVQLSAQESTSPRPQNRNGLTVSGGIGYLAVRDEYISGEKYTGTIPVYGITWTKNHETYDFRLHLEYQEARTLKNYGVSAEVQQFRIVLDYLYPLAELNLFNRRGGITLGPAVNVFSYHRRQIIAGPEYLQSNLALVSGGIRSEAVFPWTQDLQVFASLQLSLLSVSFHSVNSNASDQSSSKLLTPFSGLEAAGQIGVWYWMTGSLAVSAGYRFDVTRVSAWDYFISANDNFIASLTYAF